MIKRRKDAGKSEMHMEKPSPRKEEILPCEPERLRDIKQRRIMI